MDAQAVGTIQAGGVTTERRFTEAELEEMVEGVRKGRPVQVARLEKVVRELIELRREQDLTERESSARLALYEKIMQHRDELRDILRWDTERMSRIIKRR